MSALDDMLYRLDADKRTSDGGCAQWEPCVRGLTERQVWEVLDSFGPKAKDISPADFGKARRRIFPPDPCHECADTGQLWDGSEYLFCACPMGDHMRAMNNRIARESEAARPIWARATTPAMRRLEVVE